MADKSSIEWTDATWNPVTGCTRVSTGCDHCYAETLINTRQSKNPKSVRFGHRFNEVMVHPDRLKQVLTWRRPRRIFVNSLSDLFHRDIPDAFKSDVFAVMERANWHEFQILTKRPDRMRSFVKTWIRNHAPGRAPSRHIWLGTSIESNDFAWRADMLRETPAAIRFLSLEPLVGSVNRLDINGIDWIVVGGESGKDARPMNVDWVREIRDRCSAHGVAFFFKQWGGGHKKRGHDEALLDGRRWTEYPKSRVLPS